MNWNYWLPWREYPQDDTEDSESGGRVISGEGEGRVIVSEEEGVENLPYEITD